MLFFFIFLAIIQIGFSENFLKNYIGSKKAFIFDVGAHVGKKADYYLDCGASKILLIECQPNLIKLLRKKYDKYKNITIIDRALSDKKLVLPLYICEEATTISTMSPHWKNGRFKNYKWRSKVDVKTTTLDSLIGQFGIPDYCKIDVEGHESRVIKGLSKPIPLISFEFTKEFLIEAIECLTDLQKIGYSKFNIVEGETEEFIFDNWQALDVIVQYVEESSNELIWGDIYAFFP